MRILALSALLVSTAIIAAPSATANDVFERSHEAGVQVYRGITPKPDFRLYYAIQAAEQRKAEAEFQRKLAKRKVRALERQARAFEDLAYAVEDLSAAPRGYGYGYGGGQFFNGDFTNFPLIPTRDFATRLRPEGFPVRGSGHTQGMPGLPKY